MLRVAWRCGCDALVGLSETATLVRTVAQAEPASGDYPRGRPREFVQGLERGLGVIRALAGAQDGMSITRVAQRAGLTRAVARRYLFTLRSLGYLAQVEDRFVVTARMLDLGLAYLSSIDLPNRVQPHMQTITRTLPIRCSVAVAILDGSEIVYVARHAAERLHVTIGSRLHAHAASMGKILLGSLPPDRLEHYLANTKLVAMTANTITDPVVLRQQIEAGSLRGWAVADGESKADMRSLAVPLVDGNGATFAAMNLSVLTHEVSMEQLISDCLPVLAAAARAAESSLSSRQS